MLIGGTRALDTNWDASAPGILTDPPGAWTNDFFGNLYGMATTWQASDESQLLFEGRDRRSGELKYTATRADLIFGSNAQLRAVGEVYAADDGHEKFGHDFVAAWDKVMMPDRFDIA